MIPPYPALEAITQPRVEHVPIDMRGKSALDQIRADWGQAPCYKIIVLWIIAGLAVPAGFITDFASIPRLLDALILPDGALYLWAILHDFGYQHGYLLEEFVPGKEYPAASWEMYSRDPKAFGPYMPIYVGESQRFFDRMLRDGTIAATGASVQAYEAYTALRGFGCIAWGNYRHLGPGAYGINSLGLPGVEA